MPARVSKMQCEYSKVILPKNVQLEKANAGNRKDYLHPVLLRIDKLC